MKILISPAKSLDYQSKLPTEQYTLPRFLAETETLNEVLKKKTPKKLASLMDISAALATLNHERNLARVKEYSPENARQAMFAFAGEVYVGLDAYTLSEELIHQAQEKLRILSGLYGLLRPLDLVQPYRLEMGTSLKVGRKPNLYKFWDKKITEAINSELVDNDVVVNLASQEYFGAVKPDLLKAKLVTPIFKDYSNGHLKVISFFAKKARGLMVRHILENNIENAEELKTFHSERYEFDEKLSNDREFVFVR